MVVISYKNEYNLMPQTVHLTKMARCPWLVPVILATQEAEIRRIVVWSQPGQMVHETLSWKTLHTNRANDVAQSVGPEFKSQYYKKKSWNGKFGVKYILPQ
jgi:hypothetical protein